MNKIFLNPNQIEEWVEAAECIEHHHGTETALGSLIGEKFYNLVDKAHRSRRIARLIEEERKKPDYNPIREVVVLKSRLYTENLDAVYEEKKEFILKAEGMLLKFAFLIYEAFDAHAIKRYLESHPRLGVQGHVSSDEQYTFVLRHGVIEHSIETEVRDALIFGDMMKYFGINA